MCPKSPQAGLEADLRRIKAIFAPGRVKHDASAQRWRVLAGPGGAISAPGYAACGRFLSRMMLLMSRPTPR